MIIQIRFDIQIRIMSCLFLRALAWKNTEYILTWRYHTCIYLYTCLQRRSTTYILDIETFREWYCGWLRNPASPWMVETLKKRGGINHLSTGDSDFSTIHRIMCRRGGCQSCQSWRCWQLRCLRFNCDRSRVQLRKLLRPKVWTRRSQKGDDLGKEIGIFGICF